MEITDDRLRSIGAQEPSATAGEAAMMAEELLRVRAKPKPARSSKKSDAAATWRALLIAARSIEPVMGRVLLTGKGLRAWTDALQLECEGPALGPEPMAAVVDCEALYRALRGAKGSITWDGARTFTNGDATFQIDVAGAEDYPIMGKFDVAPDGGPWQLRHSGSIDFVASDLQELLARVHHAVSKDYTLPNRWGVQLSPGVAIATDGHRIAVTDVDASDKVSRDQGVLLPRPAVDLLHGRLLKRMTGPVVMRWCWFYEERPGRGVKGQVELTGAGWILRAQLADVDYVPWQKVIPSQGRFTAALRSRKELLDALKRLSTAEKVDLIADANGERLKLDGQAADGAKSSILIPAISVTPGFEIRLNHSYFVEALESLEGSEVVLNYGYSKDPGNDPIKISCVEAPCSVRVIMPMRREVIIGVDGGTARPFARDHAASTERRAVLRRG